MVYNSADILYKGLASPCYIICPCLLGTIQSAVHVCLYQEVKTYAFGKLIVYFFPLSFFSFSWSASIEKWEKYVIPSFQGCALLSSWLTNNNRKIKIHFKISLQFAHKQKIDNTITMVGWWSNGWQVVSFHFF